MRHRSRPIWFACVQKNRASALGLQRVLGFGSHATVSVGQVSASTPTRRSSAHVLSTHATGGLSTHDVELAHRISAIAVATGVTPEPTTGQAVEIAIDTMDADRIRPFWAAVMGYQVAKDGAVVDPQRHGPPIWFQDMDEPRTDRDRFHIDVTVPHDEAETRVAAAIAAGGRLVSAEFARSWWILADADGNEACVCTWQDRG